MSRARQAVNGLVAAALPGLSNESVEGRKVDGATLAQASPRGGLTGRSGSSGLVGPLHVCSQWKWAGQAGRSTLLDCEKPSVIKCGICARSCEIRCRATRDDRCPGCARRHCWDVARKIRSGFSAERMHIALTVVLCGTREERRQSFRDGGNGSFNGDRPSGFYLTTLTAPGVRGGMHWDRSICGHRRGECTNSPHGKSAGGPVCKVYRMIAAKWNGEAPRRWNDWITDLRRVLGVDVQYCGTWETQKRGLLHRHVLIFVPGVSAARYESVGREIAIRLGFGSQFDVEQVAADDPKALAMVAGYVASYVTKCGDGLATCVNPRTGEILRGSYRRWSASGDWGVSMKQIRQERVQWAMERTGTGVGCGGARDEHAAPGGAAALDSEQKIYASSQQPEPVLGVSLA